MSGSPGFFIPYRYAPDVAAPSSYAALAPFFVRAEPEFRAWIDAAAAHLDRLLGFAHGQPPAPRLDQDWFPRLDAALAYTLVRERRPRRIVEIGSGHSTRFLARAIADGGLTTRLVAIDPSPRATLAGLAIETIPARLQEVGLDAFAELQAGDVVFVDSSHILMPGTDVDMVLNGVLPLLPQGALLHVHDVFLPDAYPASWAWRGYNEQNAVATLITTRGWSILWASHYVATRFAAGIGQSRLDRLPLVEGAFESSLWLVKQ